MPDNHLVAIAGETAVISEQATLHDWLQLIKAEYLEIPGLHLTKSQVQRLWSLDIATCEMLLEALEAAKFLRRTHINAYVLADRNY